MGFVVAFLVGLGVLMAAEKSPTVQKETAKAGAKIEKQMKRFDPKNY